MKIICCDDDSAFLDVLVGMVQQELKQLEIEANVIPCLSGKQLFTLVKAAEIDAVFLDIDMPEMTGFDIAKAIGVLKDPPVIIFVSNMEHLVFESFTYNPFWFLRKSHLEDFPEMVQKLANHAFLLKQIYSVELNGQHLSVFLKDISYFESNDHYVTIYTASGSHRFKGRISEISDSLLPFYFVRTHVGFLVNCQYISLIRQNDLLLRSGEVIPVSRNRAKTLQEKYMAYIRRMKI